jgi:hypothetical protein
MAGAAARIGTFALKSISASLEEAPLTLKSPITNPVADDRRDLLYAKSTADRVDPDEKHEPLYSGRHLRNLADYLQKAHRPGPARAPRPFIWVYHLSDQNSSSATAFDDVAQFEETQSAKAGPKHGMVFLSGQASPEWLSCIGSLYQLEPEVLFQRMRFLPSADRESYFEPGLRSAGANTLRLCVPIIVSIDPKSRHVSRHELYAARKDTDSSLRKNFNQLKNAPHS